MKGAADWQEFAAIETKFLGVLFDVLKWLQNSELNRCSCILRMSENTDELGKEK